MIRFRCPECSGELSAAEEAAGRKFICPYCDKALTVPGVTGTSLGETKAATQQETFLPSSATRSIEFLTPRSNGGMLRHALIGAGLTGLSYGILLGLVWLFQVKPDDGGMLVKFTHRGWTPYVAVLLTFWSLSILGSKMLHVPRRREALRASFIPEHARMETPQEIDRVIDSVSSTSRSLHDWMLGYRIQRALEHFRISRNIKEVGDILREESDSSYAELEESYAPVRVFLWAIPILGFIGTVMGVGKAVGGFAEFLSRSQEISQIKSALSGVTQGLAVAFDTTFIALVLSLFVMMVMSAVEKVEQGQLREYEEYCHRNILRRLPAGVTTKEPEQVPGAVKHVLQELVSGMEAWKQEIQNLPTALSISVKEGWEVSSGRWIAGLEGVQQAIQKDHLWKNEVFEKMADERTGLLRDMKAIMEEERAQASGILDAAKETIAQQVLSQEELVSKYTSTLLESSRSLGDLVTLQNRMEHDLLQAVGSDGLIVVLGELRDFLKELDPAMRRIAEKPLEVEVHLAAGQTLTHTRSSNV